VQRGRSDSAARPASPICAGIRVGTGGTARGQRVRRGYQIVVAKWGSLLANEAGRAGWVCRGSYHNTPDEVKLNSKLIKTDRTDRINRTGSTGKYSVARPNHPNRALSKN
jgi:hypothetical protein